MQFYKENIYKNFVTLLCLCKLEYSTYLNKNALVVLPTVLLVS
jgi:hypothetical protein